MHCPACTKFIDARRTTLDPGLRRDDGLHGIASRRIEAAGEVQTARGRRRAGCTAKPQASRQRCPLGGQPPERGGKWIRKEAGAQRLASFPIFPRAPAGTPKGLALRGRLLLLTFLGGARKVSGCRAAPGAPFRPEKDQHQASAQESSKTRLPSPPSRYPTANTAQKEKRHQTQQGPAAFSVTTKKQDQLKITVLCPFNRMRCSVNHFTARASTTHSMSRPIAVKVSGPME